MKALASFSLLNYVLRIFTTSLVLIVGISGVNDSTDLEDDNDGILDTEERIGNPLLNSDTDLNDNNKII